MSVIIAKSGKAGQVLQFVHGLNDRCFAEGRKLTAREIQQKGPQLVRGNSGIAKATLAAINNGRG